MTNLRKMYPTSDKKKPLSKDTIQRQEAGRLLQMIKECKENNEWDEVYRLRRILDSHTQLRLKIKEKKVKPLQLKLILD